jgi:hypothetical protein
MGFAEFATENTLTHDQETQDLGQLVSFCQEFDPATGVEHPIDIVVKSPFMAMKYPKAVNTVRGSILSQALLTLHKGSSNSGEISL